MPDRTRSHLIQHAVAAAGLLLCCAPIFAQTAARPVRKSIPIKRERIIAFLSPKPLLGLAGGAEDNLPDADTRCSSDGLTYLHAFEKVGDGDPRDFYSAATDGAVLRLRRAVPAEEPVIFVRDFFAGEATLVTLMEAGKIDERDPGAEPKVLHPYLSLSDHDGANAKVIALNVHFKPLRVATSGADDFLLLGFDEANQVPVLAVIKSDGTPRRFMDSEDINPKVVRPPSPDPAAKATVVQPETHAVSIADQVKGLQGASFVPYGKDILLTYPGTTRPMRLLGHSGQNRSIQLEYPAGWVLHDVLVASDEYFFVARLEMATKGMREDHETTEYKQSIREFMNLDGSYYQELIPKDLEADVVTCAALRSLTAVFAATPDGAAPDSKTTGTGASPQVVIAIARR